jgi:integrase
LPPRIVQERLGHADIAMTLDRYSHFTPHMQRSAADTLYAAFCEVSWEPEVTGSMTEGM